MTEQPRERALRLVREGRVTYGDPYPNRTRRALEHGRPADFEAIFMIDGVSAYGGEHNTFRALAEAGVIDAYCDNDGTPHVVSERNLA